MYDITPNKYVAAEARYAISEKVKKSIIYLLNECSNKLKINSDQIQKTCTRLEKIDRIPPEIHYFHHALQNAMRNQNIMDARCYLSKLIDTILNPTDLKKEILISTVCESDWENFSVTEAIRLAEEDCNQIAEIVPIIENDLFSAKKMIKKAIDTIAQYDQDMYEEIIEHVNMIKVFQGKITMGFTDVRILGAMFIRVPRLNLDPITYFFEHIIHEASHIHLNSLMAVDPLILNSRDERFTSPLRNDPRPMIGVFHATFVSARIARSLMILYTKTNNNDLLHPLAETLDETLRGIIEIEKHAKLTQAGCQLVESINNLLQTASEMPEWRFYNFLDKRSHRFGAGVTKVSALQKAVA